MLYIGGKTGTAPGTITMSVGPYHEIKLAGLGYSRPSDFDRARAQLDYLPYYKGWIVGDLQGGLGQVGPNGAIDYSDPVAVKAAVAELEVHRARLAAEQASEDVKHTKSSRVWLAVGGLVGVASVLIAALALRKR